MIYNKSTALFFASTSFFFILCGHKCSKNVGSVCSKVSASNQSSIQKCKIPILFGRLAGYSSFLDRLLTCIFLVNQLINLLTNNKYIYGSIMMLHLTVELVTLRPNPFPVQ